MSDRKSLEREILRLNRLIDEAEVRLGAHSVKPILMQQLFELEEKRDGLREQLNALAEQSGKKET